MEYFRQAKELVPKDIESVLDALYEGEGYKIAISRLATIAATAK